jgi:hypothetical protein
MAQGACVSVWLIVKEFSPKATAKAPTPMAAELHPA